MQHKINERFPGNAEVEATIGEIERTRPLLDHLADQLLEASEDRWNVIIGDDAGGRLVVKYVREVLRGACREVPPTYFITGSGTYRHANGRQPYTDYLQHLTQQLGEPLRPLIVTETVGTGAGILFLKDVMRPFSESDPEVAALATSVERRGIVDYAGGSGDEALKQVWEAFESPPRVSLGRRLARKALQLLPRDTRTQLKARTGVRITMPTGNRIVGISPDLNASWPVVRVEGGRNAQASAAAFQKMKSMAGEYIDSRSFDD